MATDTQKQDESQGQAKQALDRVREREQQGSQFSWTKGIVVGVLGKFAGSAVVSEIRKGHKRELNAHVMRDAHVQNALNRAASNHEAKHIIDTAMKEAAQGVAGMKGHMLRNPGVWAIVGGVVGGIGALGIEYGFHSQKKKDHEDNLHDLQAVEDNMWTNRIKNERQAAQISADQPAVRVP